MNSASKDFPRHLAALREKMLHPTEYESAVYYFLQEFAGDKEFVRASDPEKMPALVAALGNIVSKALGKSTKLNNVLVSYLRAHRFVHGNAQAGERIVLFFYFEEADTGMVMLIPGVRGEGEMIRFRTNGLVDPQRN